MGFYEVVRKVQDTCERAVQKVKDHEGFQQFTTSLEAHCAQADADIRRACGWGIDPIAQEEKGTVEPPKLRVAETAEDVSQTTPRSASPSSKGYVPKRGNNFNGDDELKALYENYAMTDSSSEERRRTPHTDQREFHIAPALSSPSSAMHSPCSSGERSGSLRGSFAGAAAASLGLTSNSPKDFRLGLGSSAEMQKQLASSVPRRDTPHTALRQQTTAAQQIHLQRHQLSLPSMGSSLPAPVEPGMSPLATAVTAILSGSALRPSDATAGTFLQTAAPPEPGQLPAHRSAHYELVNARSQLAGEETSPGLAPEQTFSPGMPPSQVRPHFSTSLAGRPVSTRHGHPPLSISPGLATYRPAAPPSEGYPHAPSSSLGNPSVASTLLMRRRRGVGNALSASLGSSFSSSQPLPSHQSFQRVGSPDQPASACAHWPMSGTGDHLEVVGADDGGSIGDAERVSPHMEGRSLTTPCGLANSCTGISRFTPHLQFREEAAVLLASSATNQPGEVGEHLAGAAPSSAKTKSAKHCFFVGVTQTMSCSVDSSTTESRKPSEPLAVSGDSGGDSPSRFIRRGPVELPTSGAALLLSKPPPTGPSTGFRHAGLLGNSAPSPHFRTGRSFLLDDAENDPSGVETPRKMTLGEQEFFVSLATSVPAFCRVRATAAGASVPAASTFLPSTAAESGLAISPSRRQTLHTVLREGEYVEYATQPASAVLTDHRGDREAPHQYHGEYAT